MSTNRLLLQRLKNAAAATYVGRVGEVTIDVLGNKLLKIHDGVTPGGANLQVAAVSAPATAQQLGSVRVGANLSIDADGVLSAEDGNYTLPTATGSVLGGVKVGTNLTIDGSGVLSAQVVTYDQSLNSADGVQFSSVQAGEFQFTNNAVSKGSTQSTVVADATSVVYTYNDWYTSAKLVFTVEGQLDSGPTGDRHSQTCEATVAATYNTPAEPVMSVYGVVYTSVTPLANFTVRRGTGVNAGKIEILAANNQTNNTISVRVNSLQFVSIYD